MKVIKIYYKLIIQNSQSLDKQNTIYGRKLAALIHKLRLMQSTERVLYLDLWSYFNNLEGLVIQLLMKMFLPRQLIVSHTFQAYHRTRIMWSITGTHPQIRQYQPISSILIMYNITALPLIHHIVQLHLQITSIFQKQGWNYCSVVNIKISI